MSYAMVYLDIKDTAPKKWQYGFTTTTSPEGGKMYWYKFSAGTDGMGGVTFKTGSGVSVAELYIGPDPRYRIKNVLFKADINDALFRDDVNDLFWTSGATTRSAFIVDTDADNLSAYYSIVVHDKKENLTFTCDPPIRNQPG